MGFVKRMLRNPLTSIGGIGLFVFLITAIFANLIQPYPEDSRGATNMDHVLKPPSSDHFFGTDMLGRDVFSNVVAGSRISLFAGGIATIAVVCVGTALGLIAGFWGGWIDELIMRITDFVLCFPSLLLAMVISTALGASLQHAMVAVAITWWPVYSRLARGEVVSVREETFIESTKAIGAGSTRIIFRHILPNCLAPILIVATMDIGLIILTTSSLSFLGLGARPPTPEWGLLVTTGRTQFLTHWWVATFPGLALFSVVLSFSLLGDGLREILDPRLRRGRGK
jgi:peptide/nickel transport system permease protein